MSALGKRITVKKGDEEKVWRMFSFVEGNKIKINILCPDERTVSAVAQILTEIIEKIIAFSNF
ncbi:MAG: hypothetical protein DRP00_05320 [Candidatus Aenigmatarchaeota archaeon]|nr:MAG: hypothetical protein DRP00_05320 [Candidatus Aenigmarchaeota archaeon]